MSKDYRMSFVRDVETALANHFPAEQVTMISNIVIKALSNYEIAERCTALVPLDDTNERLIKRYRACLMVDGKAKSTIQCYSYTLTKLSDAVGIPFPEMNIYHVRNYLACEQERGLAAGTLENQRANISAFFQWMTDEEIIPKNPLSTLNPIKIPDEIEDPFSDIEIDAMRSACKKPKERALIEFLLSSGVRVEEASNMDMDKIDFHEMTVHVVRGKGGKDRITYITSVAAKHMKAYIKTRQEYDGALFLNQRHKRLRPGGIQHILRVIGDRAGVSNVHPHRFRRTLATNLADRGMDIQDIQKILGHSNIATTMRYIKVTDKKVKASYQKFIA